LVFLVIKKCTSPKSMPMGRNKYGIHMRKQYHFRKGVQGLEAWDIDRLIKLAQDFPVFNVSISAIRELDEPYWYENQRIPTCRSIAEHARLIHEVDLNFPILLSSDRRVMDGMHRAAKAAIQNLSSLPAKQFKQDPKPDYVGIHPDDLPY